MRWLRMVWRFATLDDRPMDAGWRPVERDVLPLLCRRDAQAGHHYHYRRMGR